jgi:hypothetical protein
LRFLIYFAILVLGVLIFSQAVAMIGLDPLPGDIAFHIGETAIHIPVLYSLGAVAIMGLLYWAVFR